VADLDLVTFHDDRYLPRALGKLEHLLELCRVFVDIVIHGIAIG